MAAWLGPIDISSELREDLVYATSEAASNAVEHAYRNPACSDGGDGATTESTADATTDTVTVTMWSEPGMVNIEIADRGTWLPVSAEPSNRGHGLHLIRGLVKSVEIESRSGGTTVWLRHPTPMADAVQVLTARGR